MLIFASLISPSKIILLDKEYQAFDAVFHHQMKHLEVRQKYPRCLSYFQLCSSKCFIWWWHTAPNGWYTKLTNLITSEWTNKDHRLTNITATDIIIRQKATFAHNRFFFKIMTYFIRIGCRHLEMKLSLFSEIYTRQWFPWHTRIKWDAWNTWGSRTARISGKGRYKRTNRW